MSLGKLGIKAVKWSSIATVIRFVLQFASQITLARMLGPENYGIFGMGAVVLTLTSVFSNFGFGWSLLHKKQVSEEDIRFAFTWQALVGGLATLVLFLAAPALAVFFHEVRVEWVIRWLAFTCVISAVSSPAGNLMYRDLNFKAAGLIQIGGYVAGYLLVGIPLAYAGLGVRALVAAWLVQVGVIAVGSFMAHPHSVRPLFYYPGARVTLKTGATVFITNIVNWSLGSMDRFLLSRFANAHAVGVYSMGVNLATMPSTLLMGSLQPAFTSAGSRMQDDPARMRQVYLQIIATIIVLLFPVFVYLSSASFDIVRLLYGSQWADTAWVLALMFISVPAVLCLGLSTPILWNFGRKHHESLLQLPVLLVGLPCFYYSIDYGVHAFAAVAVSLVFIRALLIGASVFHLLEISGADVWPLVARGAVLSLLTAVASAAGAASVDHLGRPALNLLTGGSLAALVVGLVVFVRPALLGRHCIAMISRFSASFGATLGRRAG